LDNESTVPMGHNCKSTVLEKQNYKRENGEFRSRVRSCCGAHKKNKTKKKTSIS